MSQRKRGSHFCECGNHAWAVMTKGYVTLVDPQDAHFLSMNWHAADSCPHGVYANREKDGRTVGLHRQIMGEPPSEVDHRNRNPLDNRRENLRTATRSQNIANSRSPMPCGYRGVSFVKRTGKWRAQIRIDGYPKHLGYFDSPERAAKAYAEAADAQFGEYAFSA